MNRRVQVQGTLDSKNNEIASNIIKYQKTLKFLEEYGIMLFVVVYTSAK